MNNLFRLILLASAAIGVVSAHSQTISEVLLPQYLANGTTTANRMQTAARFTLGGLTPNATYRYYVSGDTNLTPGTGAGNYFGINNAANTAGFIQGYTSGKALSGTLLANNESSSASRYSEFTTDSSGNYTGWFGMLPTGNARFTAGNAVRMGLLLNDGAGGTALANTLYASSTITALGQGTAIGQNQGTYLVGDSTGAPDETMVVIYDNVLGNGRPIWGSWVESDGIIPGGMTLYEANVTAGRWGAYVPNDLAGGIRRVEYWDIANNNLLGVATDADGIWTSLPGTAFANANGDTTFNGGVTDMIGIVAPVPEPSAGLLIVSGGLLFLAVRRFRARD